MSAPAVPAVRRFGIVNWRGLRALCARDLRRSLKQYRYSLLGPVVSSLLFLVVFQLALGTSNSALAAQTYAAFLAPGLVIFAICERAYGTAAEFLVYDKLEGIIVDTLMAPLTPAELTVGYACSAAIDGLITGAAVMAAMLLFVELPFASPWLALLFAVAGALLHGLLGVLIGLWSERWDHYTAAATFLVIPFAFLSGTFYPVSALPELGRTIVQLNPVFYVIDGFRAGVTGHADADTAVGLLVVGTVVLVLALATCRLLRIGYKIKP